jgi:ferredoxin
VTYVIAEPCAGVKNATCVEVCPVQCIHSTPDAQQYFVDPEMCIECEQCALVCPVNAIFVHTELPVKWLDFIEINARFFAEHKVAAASVDFATAARMAQAALDKAIELGAAIAVAIVDATGEPIVERLMPAASAAAQGEAATVARTLVGSLAEAPVGTSEPRGLGGSLSRPLAHAAANVPGNIAIFSGVEVVGAIGVVGGGDTLNMLCSRAALAAYEPMAH